MVVYQPRRGFRYGSEVFWLVGFALEGAAARTAVDLGTGSGVAALLLGAQGIATVGIDVRPEWGACWERSLAECALRAPVRLVRADVRNWRSDPVDLVISNPPFFRSGAGPASSDAWKAAARTESTATLRDFLRGALDLLADGARACLVLPVARAPETAAAAEALGARIGRRVQVGRRRVLLEVTRRPGPEAPAIVLEEGHPRVRGWYARLTAR